MKRQRIKIAQVMMNDSCLMQNKTLCFTTFVVLIALILFPGEIHSSEPCHQFYVSGYVYDMNSGQPVPGVMINFQVMYTEVYGGELVEKSTWAYSNIYGWYDAYFDIDGPYYDWFAKGMNIMDYPEDIILYNESMGVHWIYHYDPIQNWADPNAFWNNPDFRGTNWYVMDTDLENDWLPYQLNPQICGDWENPQGPGGTGAGGIDTDENGINDVFEMELAEMFVPTYILNDPNEFVRPEPVQYLGVEKQDLWFLLININGAYLSDYMITSESSFDPPIHTWQPWVTSQEEYSNIVYEPPYDYIGDPPGEYTRGSYDLRFHYNYAGDCNSETCWSEYYDDERDNNQFPTTIYVHLIRYDVTAGYYIIIQYWTFYPYNDFINNHEGDWEHINVILNSQIPDDTELLSVEYYFHQKYVDWSKDRLEIDDGTHPVVYVGGEHPDHPGVHSGGNYPSSGLWEDAAAVCMNEYVNGDGPIINYAEFIDDNPDDDFGIIILPDVEDVNFSANPDMSWFGVQIPWGYIEAESYVDWGESLPFVPDVGNSPPPGPAYRAGWDTHGDDGYELYEPCPILKEKPGVVE